MIQVPPTNKQYYINARALTFSENDLDNPNRVAVSLVSGTVIMVYEKGIIDYAADGSYEKWTLRGYSTKLVKNDKYYIYARLSRTDKTALIVFSVNSYNLDGSITTITGKDEEGNDITETTDPNENYFYVKIGELTETDGSSMRELTYDSGLLGTDKGKDEAGGWNEMWELSKLSTPWLIRAKQWLADFTVKGFIKLVGGLKFSKGQEGDEKPITDIKRSVDSDNELILNEDGTQIKDPNYVPISDETIPTTKYLHSVTDERFLRKDKDDRSVGTISSDKGFEVGNYVPGELGIGGIFKIDENGDSYLEVDKALFRKIAYFVEIMIKKLSHVGGSIILSPASMKCSKVEEHETYYRCYFENEHEGKTINQEFVVGDQARSQTFNIKEGLSQNVSNQYYWRLVVGVGSNYIDLSKTDCDSGSGIPLAGDDIVQLGNRDNPSRQRAIILSSYGEGTPSIIMYRGIKSYSMSDAKMPLRLSPDGNIIEGDFISKSGKNLEEWMSEVEVNWDKVLEQTDKEFTMWFFEYDPSPEVYPESEWFTDELRALHEQDLFYNTAKGMAWRYTLKDGVFFWELVTDADTLKALEDAAKAQQTADGAVQRLDSIVSDGKLSAVEKKEVRKEWASIMDAYEWNMYSSERIGVDMQSQEVVGYSNAYNTLSTYITPLLDEDGDSDINPDEYRGYWTDYYTTETKLRNFLSEKAKEKADDVNDRVDDIVSDGVLSSLEKKEVLKEWQFVVAQYTINKNYADKYELDYSDYTDAYHALGTYLNNGITWNGSGTPSWLGTQIGVNTTLSSPTDYRKAWVDYYKAESILIERISEAGLGTRVQNFKTYPNELPVPPYNVGDRWMNAYYTVGGVTYAENDDMVCVRAKAKNEVASINDWEFSSSMNSDTKKDIEATIKNLGDRIDLNVESIDALNKAYTNLGISIDGVAEEVAIYAQKVSANETSIAELKVKTNSIEQSVSNTQGGVEEAKELASKARSLAITASMTGMYSGEEYNQTTNPWQNWSSGTEYKHVGAIWYNPNTGVTKRYIGTDGTNSWETVDDNVYSSATFVFQNKSKWSVVAANFNDDGSVKGNSGIVTTSSYAALFSEQWNENESVRAEIGTFVTKNADGTLESNVKITADNIKLEGVTTINGSFRVDTDGTTHIGGFTVYDGKMTSDGDYKMTIDPVSNNPSISISFADHTYATMRVSNVSPYSGQLELYGAMGAISLLNGGFARFENSSGSEGITIEGDSKLGPSLTIRKGSYYVSIGINSDNMAVIGSNCWPYYDDSTTRKQGTLSWDNSRYGKFK